MSPSPLFLRHCARHVAIVGLDYLAISRRRRGDLEKSRQARLSHHFNSQTHISTHGEIFLFRKSNVYYLYILYTFYYHYFVYVYYIYIYLYMCWRKISQEKRDAHCPYLGFEADEFVAERNGHVL